MSNHFTGLHLGPPLGDHRLDLCDLYVLGEEQTMRAVIDSAALSQAARRIWDEGVLRTCIQVRAMQLRRLAAITRSVVAMESFSLDKDSLRAPSVCAIL